MSFNVNDDRFNDSGKVLVFNNSKSGVVTDCVVEVTKKTAKDSEKSPNYKIIVKDSDQIKNVDKLEEDKIYPVNKGYYYQDSFKSDKAEAFAVKELKHLLKITEHPMDDSGKFIFEKSFTSYNNFLDYVMDFVGNQVVTNKSWRFDVVVDYGNSSYPQKFLQLNGYPHFICRSGDMKLSLNRDALTERPKEDDDVPFKGSTASSGKTWLLED